MAKTLLLLLSLTAAGLFLADGPKLKAAGTGPAISGDIARGRYLVRLAGCNDCHTSGYAMNSGKIPDSEWLTGDSLGYRGPWGTTYPTNLRLFMQELTEEEWVELATAIETRPPMPWFNLRDASEDDLRAIFRFVRHLGPAGQAAPQSVGPDEEPQTEYILFVPQTPGARE